MLVKFNVGTFIYQELYMSLIGFTMSLIVMPPIFFFFFWKGHAPKLGKLRGCETQVSMIIV